VYYTSVAARTGRHMPAPARYRTLDAWRGVACLMVVVSHAAVFVCPSVYEPLGIVNLEAMACEAPVVATDTGGIPEVVVSGEYEVGMQDQAFLGPESTWAAEAAECAGEEGRFFDLHDRLYALQRGENTGGFTKPNLQKVARDLGLSAGFDACLTSDRYAQRVRADTSAGQQKGVSATPTFFVNGRKVEGSLSFEQLRAIIDPLVK